MESAGYAVESFDSAEQFLASGSAQNAACLIVDIQLPGITGLELQDKLAGADNRAPIVFVSAQGTRRIVKRVEAGRGRFSLQALPAGRPVEDCGRGDRALNRIAPVPNLRPPTLPGRSILPAPHLTAP